MRWRSSYKLPVSFIVFFVLAFFLLGEQLPALPTYLFGPGSGEGGPSKLHILDLAAGDALHRPFAYVIIGTVIWGLFRILAWPLAYLAGAALWTAEQLTLTPLDQRPTLANLAVFMPTFWTLLTLAPYSVYRWVDRKWGRVGRRKAILMVFFVNVLLFGFFAWQIYVTGNSHRSLGKSGGQPGLPANICPERLIIEKDKQTMAEFEGKILPLSGEVQNWIEKNCQL